MNPGQFFVASWNSGTRLFHFVGWNKKGDALCVNYDAAISGPRVPASR
jgi:hypothetical protein